MNATKKRERERETSRTHINIYTYSIYIHSSMEDGCEVVRPGAVWKAKH